MLSKNATDACIGMLAGGYNVHQGILLKGQIHVCWHKFNFTVCYPIESFVLFNMQDGSFVTIFKIVIYIEFRPVLPCLIFCFCKNNIACT